MGVPVVIPGGGKPSLSESLEVMSVRIYQIVVSTQTPPRMAERPKRIRTDIRAIAMGRSWSNPVQNHSRTDRLCGGGVSRRVLRLGFLGPLEGRGAEQECADDRRVRAVLRPSFRRLCL